VGDSRGVYRVLVGRPEWKIPLQDLGVDGWITLKYILKSGRRAQTRLIRLRTRTGGGLL